MKYNKIYLKERLEKSVLEDKLIVIYHSWDLKETVILSTCSFCYEIFSRSTWNHKCGIEEDPYAGLKVRETWKNNSYNVNVDANSFYIADEHMKYINAHNETDMIIYKVQMSNEQTFYYISNQSNKVEMETILKGKLTTVKEIGYPFKVVSYSQVGVDFVEQYDNDLQEVKKMLWE